LSFAALRRKAAPLGRVDLLCIDELGYMELDRRSTAPPGSR